jgi:hypothetical protein
MVETVDVRVKFAPAPPEVTSPVTRAAGITTRVAFRVPAEVPAVPLTTTKSPTATLGELTPGSLYCVELETTTVTAVPSSDFTVELLAVRTKLPPAPPEVTVPSTLTT